MSSILLPAAALLLFGGFVYLAFNKTPIYTEEVIAPRSQFIKHLSDPADEWVDPSNLTSNPQRFKTLHRETGQFGQPRVYTEGHGHSVNVVYGENLRSL